MRKNTQFLIDNHGVPADVSIQGTIDVEAQLGVTRLNGENQKKELKKDKKGSWEWKYVSNARTLVRL